MHPLVDGRLVARCWRNASYKRLQKVNIGSAYHRAVCRMPARPAGPLAACLCLLLACAPPATANVGSGGTGRTGQVAAKALDGTDTDGASDTIPNSSCNGTSAAFEGTQPIPCTAQQEQDALNDLAADTPSPSPSPAAAGGGASPSGQLPPPLDVLSTSECNATDPDGYTIAVDLMDPDLIDVVAAVADAFVASEGNASYWQVRRRPAFVFRAVASSTGRSSCLPQAVQTPPF